MTKQNTIKFASTKERLIQFIDYKKINNSVFLKETGLKRGFLDGDKLKSSVSDLFIAKIIAKYPELNLYWLVTGNGNMLQKEKTNSDDIVLTELLDRIENLASENGALKKEIDLLHKEKKTKDINYPDITATP
ncbi:MAG: hypothetical protein AB7D05_05990 [Mangrovibacterium sp.]